uniref:Uncharacterized protein n=1 Tax=Panagrellus redivivus TaxID=6233 RepID=A0A7E4VB73_PANRE
MLEDFSTAFALIGPVFAATVTGFAMFIGCANKSVSKESSSSLQKRHKKQKPPSGEVPRAPNAPIGVVKTKEVVPQRSMLPVQSRLKNTTSRANNTTYDDGEYENVSDMNDAPVEKTAVSV